MGNHGAGIYNLGTLDIEHSTIAFNRAMGGPGAHGEGYYNAPPDCVSLPGGDGTHGLNGWAAGLSGPGVTLLNTILAANLPTNCWGSIVDGGHNLSSDASAAFVAPGSRKNIDPLLGPLAYNGGPTMTISLSPGSPAIDAGDPTAAPPTDQRGLPRLGTPDIGAYEFWPSIALLISPLASGGFQIQVTGPGGQACRLLTSMTLTDWSTVATNQIASDGVLTFQVQPSSDAQRFFRAVIP